MNISKMIADIQISKVKIGKERDKLYDILDELEGLKESCDRAYEDLENAIEALSELV